MFIMTLFHTISAPAFISILPFGVVTAFIITYGKVIFDVNKTWLKKLFDECVPSNE